MIALLWSPIGKITLLILAVAAVKCGYDAKLRSEGAERAIKKIQKETEVVVQKQKEEGQKVREEVTEKLNNAKTSVERLKSLDRR